MNKVETEASGKARKRKRDNADNTTEDDAATKPQARKNAIIGLEFTDGCVIYCSKSTLANAGGYFGACFGERELCGEPSRNDEHGRSIHFVVRDGELFKNHILPFILTKCPGRLVPFSDNPDELWRELRQEAEFYALDDLAQVLHVTHSCPYDAGDDRGVLYWLGTDKGKNGYRNPHLIGAIGIDVGGVIDLTVEETVGLGARETIPLNAYVESSKQALVEYRSPIKGFLMTSIQIGSVL